LIAKTCSLICAILLPAGVLFAQAPINVTVETSVHEFAIPHDFVGLGFETKSVVANTYGVHGNFFSPENTGLITLFRNIGIRNIRVGGGTVDGCGPIPNDKDIDNLFEFARATNIKVIYSVRLENLAACPNPHLAEDDAKIVRYIWSKYRANVASFSIGNEPDVRQYHSRSGAILDPAIYETKPGISGSAYLSYFADWKHFADVIRKAIPGAKFSGPDTAVSSRGSFTPNPEDGVSWTVQFARDLKGTEMLAEALQHHYVWGRPGNTTAQEAIDDMLSSAWDDDTEIGNQSAFNGGTAKFHSYPYVYNTVLAPLVSMGVPYRMTEANDCLHGVVGASNGYAAALWALDYMHWWAAHHMAGVNFHNNPWIPTDTIVPDPNPCGASGCDNYRATAKALGIKAFSLGSHGFVEPVTIANPQKINLTAYAVGTDKELYVTVINKTHSSTHDATAAHVVIDAPGFDGATVDSLVLTDGEPGNAALMTGTLGGAGITNDAPWEGKWTPIGVVQEGEIAVTVESTTAAVVRFRAASEHSDRMRKQKDAAGISRREFLHNSSVAAGAVIAASVLPLAVAQGTGTKRPNIVFLYTEGQRADALSVADHPILKTPQQDRIGHEGVYFKNSFCVNALCAPARAATFTGLYSHTSGALDNKTQEPLPTDIPVFTDLLHEGGGDSGSPGTPPTGMTRPKTRMLKPPLVISSSPKRTPLCSSADSF